MSSDIDKLLFWSTVIGIVIGVTVGYSKGQDSERQTLEALGIGEWYINEHNEKDWRYLPCKNPKTCETTSQKELKIKNN